MRSLNRKYVLWGIVFFIPFVLGATGYLMAGEDISQSLYASACLYVFECYDAERNWMIETARWLAPLSSLSGLFLVLEDAAKRIKNFVARVVNKATVIYCEAEEQQILTHNIPNSVIASKDKVYPGVRNSIIMLSDDLENLNFYYKNEEKFADSNVYMRLQQMDSFLLKEHHIKFFNETELIARDYWKKYNLLDYLKGEDLKVKIAIIGFEQLGEKILSFGLMNNIYTLNQQIEYHVWGNCTAFEQLMVNMNFMNKDTVVYHGTEYVRDLGEIAQMDRIIVTEEQNLELLQNLLYLCNDKEIDYYNRGEAALEHIFAGSQLRSFGMQSSVLTEQNIMSEELYRLGMELNYSYFMDYAEDIDRMADKEVIMVSEWEKLNGFLKASNIAAADYHEIRLMILEHNHTKSEELSQDEREVLSEMEHIRWSRFHFINHWRYGELEDGKRKDASRRIHTYLVPYGQLSPEVQKMDWDTIKRLLTFKK